MRNVINIKFAEHRTLWILLLPSIFNPQSHHAFAWRISWKSKVNFNHFSVISAELCLWFWHLQPDYCTHASLSSDYMSTVGGLDNIVSWWNFQVQLNNRYHLKRSAVETFYEKPLQQTRAHTKNDCLNEFFPTTLWQSRKRVKFVVKNHCDFFSSAE